MNKFIFSLCLCTAASLLLSPCRGAEVRINAPGITRPIGLSTLWFSDSTGSMPFEDVLRTGVFRPSESEIPRFGLTRSTHWLRFTLVNNSSEPELALSWKYPGIDELDLYVDDGTGFHCIAKAGLARYNGTGRSSTGEQQFAIPVAPGKSAEIVLKIKGFKHLHAPMVAGTSAALIGARIPRQIALGVYMGIMLVLFLYNFFVFLSTHDRNYLFYVLSILAVTFTQLTLMGYGPFNYFAFDGWITSRAGLLFNLIAIPFGYEFARGFMNTKFFVPRMDRWVPLIYLIIAAICTIYVLVDPWMGQELGNSISGLAALYLLTMGLVSFRKGSRQAGFFLLAWTAFLVGVVLFVLKDEGAIPYSATNVYAMPMGSAIEGILLSFGLADRINILRKEKEQSQAAALASSMENERIIREQNVMLEQKVAERTHALQESNQHLKQTQSQLVDAEKMASLGQLTAGIAHEINNPVNFIASNIPPLRRNLSEMLEVLSAYQHLHGSLDIPALNDIRTRAEDLGLAESIDELDEIINSIEEGAGRTADIVRGLRNFSRLDEDDLKIADINDGIRSTITVLGSQLNEQAELELLLADMPKVECYAGKLNQVFMNMLNNAVQSIRMRPAGSGPGLIRIGTQQIDDLVKITISDNGMGMDAEVLSRIFEPFYTTKDVGEGTGLGLSIAYSIVEKHHGTIQVESAPGQGASFIISIPVRQPVQHQQRA